ncbi:unnamed protein product [Polarella glacialis]|uniref:SbsA Ig-like domain-containing protein n=1 Tax=Polarella glacialis TaxID=89957 RepID=A0A813D4I4_POLGL|nr:unnamed protein product [Polarella glacialis]
MAPSPPAAEPEVEEVGLDEESDGEGFQICYVRQKILDALKEKLKKGEEIDKASVEQLTAAEEVDLEEMMVPVDASGLGDDGDLEALLEKLGPKAVAEAFIKAEADFQTNKAEMDDDMLPKPMTAQEWIALAEQDDDEEGMEGEEEEDDDLDDEVDLDEGEEDGDVLRSSTQMERCCEGYKVAVRPQLGLSPVAVPPCALTDNEYGLIPLVAQVRATSSMGTLGLWPVPGLYFDHALDTPPMHNASSQVVVSGPGVVIQRALASKLFLLHVDGRTTDTVGTVVIEVVDARSGLIASSSCPIEVQAQLSMEALPKLTLELSAVNASFRIGGRLRARDDEGNALGFEVALPAMSITSEAPESPCLLHFDLPIGQLLAPRALPADGLPIQWWTLPNASAPAPVASYRLFAKDVTDATQVLQHLRYRVAESDLTKVQLRVPLTVTAYALPGATMEDIDKGILRDQRIIYLELLAEPSIPVVTIEGRELEAPRAKPVSLSLLGLSLTYPRPLEMRLSCGACVFQDDALQWTGVHQFSGSVSALQAHFAGLQIMVSSASVDLDLLNIRIYDPVTLHEGWGVDYDKELTDPSKGNLVVDLSVRIPVTTSSLARGPPVLSILSQGITVNAGVSIALVGAAALRSADPSDPIGLRAVEGLLEAHVSCGQGTLVVDAALVVGAGSRYLADASGSARAAAMAAEAAEAVVAVAGKPLQSWADPAGASLKYADTSRPYDGLDPNSSYFGSPGLDGPGKVLRSGRKLLLRGSAIDLSRALATLVYNPDEGAGGWDSVVITLVQERGEIPIYILRRLGELVIVSPPLLSMQVGEVLRPNISLRAGPLVRPDDGLELGLSCGHCELALWSFAGQVESMGKSLAFTAKLLDVPRLLSSVTYTPHEGFLGMDRVTVKVVGNVLHANGRQAPSTEASMAVLVRTGKRWLAPASLTMPENAAVQEDQTLKPNIMIEDLQSIAPSGLVMAAAVADVASDPRHCIRVRASEAFVQEMESPSPCDLFTIVDGVSSPPGSSDCTNCTMRPSAMPEQCLTWETGQVALVLGRVNGWAMAACREPGHPGFAAQTFMSSAGPEPGTRRFCVSRASPSTLEGCVDSMGMTVLSQIYRGLPTMFYASETGSACSGQINLISGIPLGYATNATDNASGNAIGNSTRQFIGAATRCAGTQRCEYHLDLSLIRNPALECDRELYVNFTCPNLVAYEARVRIPSWQTHPTTLILQCPVTLLPSRAPANLRGSVPTGSFQLKGFRNMKHLRSLSDCRLGNGTESAGPPILWPYYSQPAVGSKAVPLLPMIYLAFNKNVFVGHGKAYVREVQSLYRRFNAKRQSAGAHDDFDRLHEFPFSLKTFGNIASFQMITPLAPLTSYELVLERDALEDAYGVAFPGLSEGAHTFTTDLGPLLPAGWRVLAEQGMSAAADPTLVGTAGWTIAELDIFEGYGCEGARLRGTPASSAGSSKADLAFDEQLATAWVSAADEVGSRLAPLNNSRGAWLGVFVEAAAILERATELSAAAASPRSRRFSLRIRPGSDGSPPPAFSVQFFIGGTLGQWYVLQTLPYLDDRCLDLPDDLDSAMLRAPDMLLPTLDKVVLPTGEASAMVFLEFSEHIQIGNGEVRLVSTSMECANVTNLTACTTSFRVQAGRYHACAGPPPPTDRAAPGVGNGSNSSGDDDGRVDVISIGRSEWPGKPPSGCISLVAFDYRVFIELSAVLEPGMGYYLEVDPGIVRDRADNLFEGILGPNVTSFEAVAALTDKTAPVLLQAVPWNEELEVTSNTTMTLAFSEDVVLGAGFVVLTPEVGKAVTYDIHGSEVNLIEGRFLAVTPLQGLPSGLITVTMSPSAIYDLEQNAFHGIQAGELVFAVLQPPPPVETSHGGGGGFESSLETLTLDTEVGQLSSFCVTGPPFALAEFAKELTYRPAPNFFGHEPMRVMAPLANLSSETLAEPQPVVDSALRHQNFVTMSSTELIQQLLQAEKQAEEVVSAAKKSRLAKLRQAKEKAEEEIKEFRAKEEAKFQKEMGFKATTDPADALKESTKAEIAGVMKDFATHKARTIEYIVGRVMDVQVTLTSTQIQALKTGVV